MLSQSDQMRTFYVQKMTETWCFFTGSFGGQISRDWKSRRISRAVFEQMRANLMD